MFTSSFLLPLADDILVLSIFGSSFILVNLLTLGTGKGISKVATDLSVLLIYLCIDDLLPPSPLLPRSTDA